MEQQGPSDVQMRSIPTTIVDAIDLETDEVEEQTSTFYISSRVEDTSQDRYISLHNSLIEHVQ